MRSVLLLTIVMLLIACAGPAPTAAVPPAASNLTSGADDLASKTVALVVHKDDDVRAYCSGVWVGPAAIVTANHCMRDVKLGERIDYVTWSDVYSPGEVAERLNIDTRGAMLAAQDSLHDLALLFAPASPDHGVAHVFDRAVRSGLQVQAMGQPLGLWWSYSRGDVAALRVLDDEGVNTLYVQATVPISPGSSGGGLFDLAGRLVGICHGTFTKGQNVNLFVHYQYVSALLVQAAR